MREATSGARPGAGGLIDLYTDRALERGADPRQLVSDYRAALNGGTTKRRVAAARLTDVGRGTAEHRMAVKAEAAPRRASVRRAARPVLPAMPSLGLRPARRLAAAGMAAALLLSLGVFAAGAEGPSFQTRYVVQPGDTLERVAEEFGVDPQAILAASGVQSPPWLTPGEILVIPARGQDPETAAAEAAALQGTSPFVVGAHVVAPGESVGQIAGWSGIDAPTLAGFNGVTDIDAVNPGQRLLIPAVFGLPGLPGGDGLTVDDGAAAAQPAEAAPETGEAAGMGGAVGWEGATIIEGTPAYQQRYGMSCEYAAAFIATETFGAGIDEEVFRQNIGESPNPHWGYRGYIDGWWGGTDDYGIYPEALAPTLQANGFVADVFYAGGDAGQLTARLDSGMPTLVWLSYLGESPVQMDDAGSYRLLPGMHVVTAYGYDDNGVYVANPANGGRDFYTWGEFMTMWAPLDGMALGVAPAS